jgi:hypothetical protein
MLERFVRISLRIDDEERLAALTADGAVLDWGSHGLTLHCLLGRGQPWVYLCKSPARASPGVSALTVAL